MQIDWLTVAAQIVNFLVLVWLLQRFLYRPITNAMARREERIESRLSEAEAVREEVEADAERLEKLQQELEASREEILTQARKQAEEMRTGLEDEIRDEMEGRRAQWQAHLEDERAAFAARLKERAGHQVIDIVGRVLKDYVGRDLGDHLAGTFTERLADLDAAARDKLKQAARHADEPARVDSSVALKPGVRSRITRAIHESVASDMEVAYSEDGDLLLGVRLTVGEQTLEWSAARFLQRLETTLDEAIEGGARDRPGRAVAGD